MRLTMSLTIACLFVLCLAGLPWERPARADRLVEQPNYSSTVRARAIVSGPNGISGEVLFFTRALSWLSNTGARGTDRTFQKLS